MIRHYFFRITGAILLILLIYLRLFRINLMTDLYFIVIDNHRIGLQIKLLCTNILVLICSCIGLFYCYRLIIKKPMIIKDRWYTKVFIQAWNILKKSLEAFESSILMNRGNTYNIIRNFSLKYYKKFGSHTYRILLYIMASYIVIAVTFLFEVLMFFKLKVFYMVLPLISLPLIFVYIIRLITLIEENLDNIENLIVIKHSILSDGKDRFIFMKKPEVNLTYHEFNSYRIEYLTIYPLRGFLAEYHHIIHTIKPYYQSFLYGSYIIGWSYILLRNILLLHDFTL